MALAAALHHSRDVGPESHNVLRNQKTARGVDPAEYYELSSDDGRTTRGERPAALLEPLPQGRMVRHAGVGYELVQQLVVPVPQTVEQLPDVLRFFDRFATVPEQVIEVPKIYTEDVPMRAVLRATQLVEQLVEVPTKISFPMIALYHAFVAQRTVEQNVDIPAVGGIGTGGGPSGFLPGQSYSLSAEQIIDNPVPRRGFDGGHGLHPGQSSSAFYGADLRVAAATAEQNVDIPAPRGAPRDFHQHPLPAAGSSDLLETANQWVFRTFPGRKKVRRSRAPRGQNWARTSAHGLRELSWWVAGWLRH